MGHSVYIEGQYENDAFDNPKGITVRCVELDCDDCMKTILRLEKPDKKHIDGIQSHAIQSFMT